ncbi:putative RDD family membrane protein YckC [Mesorhizobium soli]|uniref:RDD family protein n=1 Tax=Pseudaminobacter soli (ex Li et al. 2025) TaxID=1295366 RepID=UPI00247524BF|nr:RDD family protein [Mesorhizobium soli]MDH6234535.1 putative RDD family membrane protein YckC [Mesorhizobium soli]
MARSRHREAASRLRSLVTPEGVDLGVVLADAGTRAGAFLLDAFFIMIAGFLISLVALFGLGGLGIDSREPIAVVWIVLVFFLRNAYFLAFEARRGARTLGKRIMGLRVASRDGSGLAIDQVIARNLMREIEVFLPLSMLLARAGTGVADTLTTMFGAAWALGFALFPLFNRDRMRIGDLLAGTWVIEVPKRTLAEDLTQRSDSIIRAFRFTPEQLDVYGIAELHKLEEILRGDNDAALSTVAKAIGDKIGVPYGDDRARPFLIAYHGELRAYLERKLLLGKRRINKHDA